MHDSDVLSFEKTGNAKSDAVVYILITAVTATVTFTAESVIVVIIVIATIVVIINNRK